ncbi:MAG TPA: hypothetical protein VJI70_01995 [Candidatus Paceibacterota bacterium]
MTKTLYKVSPEKIAQRRALSASWKRAAGLLRLHKKSLVTHARRVRADWSRRA